MMWLVWTLWTVLVLFGAVGTLIVLYACLVVFSRRARDIAYSHRRRSS